MKANISTTLVTFFARYMLTPFETAQLGDIEALVNWLEMFGRSGFEN